MNMLMQQPQVLVGQQVGILELKLAHQLVAQEALLVPLLVLS